MYVHQIDYISKGYIIAGMLMEKAILIKGFEVIMANKYSEDTKLEEVLKTPETSAIIEKYQLDGCL